MVDIFSHNFLLNMIEFNQENETMKDPTIAPTSFGRKVSSSVSETVLRLHGLDPNRFGVFAEAPTVESLREQQAGLAARSEEIMALADGEGRELSDDELKEIEGNTTRIQSLSRNISAREAIANMGQGAGPRSRQAPGQASPPPNQGSGSGGSQRQTVPAQARGDGEAARFGFRNFGEYAATVRMAGGPSPDQAAQNRIQNALTTYGNESVGADGGFMVPPEFRREIAEKVLGEASLLARTDQQTTSSNSIIFPVDETTPWQSSGGLQAYWEVEAGQKTQSKPSLGQNTVRLHKLIALVPVTDELLEDAPALDGYLRRKVPDKMMAKLNTAIVSGTGAGMPKGILNSGSLITVAAEGGQSADTILFANLIKMVSRMYAPSFANAVWLANQDIMPQLMTMQFSPGSSTPVPVWMPATGVSGSPYSTLFGRPLIPVQAMPTLGDKGDLVLADMTQYLTVTKGQQIRTDVSIHLFFDYDVTAFRFVMRVGGQPWWDQPITPQNSANTLGFFVALADR